MKIVLSALTLALAFSGSTLALSGSALARDANNGDPARSYRAQTQQQDEFAAGWTASHPAPKTYAWPDQRYYGAHGMVSD